MSKGIAKLKQRPSQSDQISSINEAAAYCRTLWAAFMTYMGGIFILTAGTTHVDLLRETPVKMPLFELGVPLKLFYIVGPLLLVLFHLNFLMKLLDLRYRLRALTDDVNRDNETRIPRQSIISFDYALLAGRMVKDGNERLLLGVMTYTSVLLAPVILLLFIELQFLPAHDARVTWVHRALIFLDLAQIYFILYWLGRGDQSSGLFEKYARVSIVPMRFSRRMLRQALCNLSILGRLWRGWALIIVAGVSLFIFASPDEPLDVFWPIVWKHIRPVEIVHVRPNRPKEIGYNPAAGADIAERFGVRRSLYVADRVFWTGASPSDSVISSFEADDGIVRSNLNKGIRGSIGISLKGRNLSFANFENSKLIGADFSPDLTHQQLKNLGFPELGKVFRADYRDRFANLRGTNFSGADMRGALFLYADAEGATFTSADLSGAKIDHSNLQFTALDRAKMQEVVVRNSDLRAVYLVGANLRGADFFATRMQGSFLSQAQMQGAALVAAGLQLANMEAVNMQGSYIVESHFEGATLDRSDLSGALLDDAYLQGASLKEANLQATYFIDAKVRGINLEKAQVNFMQFQDPDTSTVGSLRDLDLQRLPESVRAGIASSEERMKCNCPILSVAIGHGVWLDPPDTEIEKVQDGSKALRAPNFVQYAAGTKAILLDLACGQRGRVPSYTNVAHYLSAGSAKYVAKGIVKFRAHEPDPWQYPSPSGFKQLDGLATAMMADACVSSNLSASLLLELKRRQQVEIQEATIKAP